MGGAGARGSRAARGSEAEENLYDELNDPELRQLNIMNGKC